MLVRDPAQRPNLADAAARVRALLDGRAGPLPPYAVPQTLTLAQGPGSGSGGLATPPRAGGARTPPDQAREPDQVLLAPRPPSAGFAGAGAAYSLAEAYLQALTPVGSGLALGGLDALARPGALTASGATHVVLLVGELEERPIGLGSGGTAERLLAGALPSAPLLRALAACAAAGVAARVVPLGPLPNGGGPEARGAAAARFLEALPALLRSVAAACGPGPKPYSNPKSCQNPDHAPPAGAGSAGPAGADDGCGDLCGQGGALAGLGSGVRGGWAAVGGVARMLAAVGGVGRAARRARAAAAARRRSGRVAPEPVPQQGVGDQEGKRAPPSGHPPPAAAQTGAQRPAERAALAAHAQAGPGPRAEPAARAAPCDPKPYGRAGGSPRVVLVAAPGYEGEAAAAAAAALMLLTRCPAHEALAALAHRHLALQVPALHACMCDCLIAWVHLLDLCLWLHVVLLALACLSHCRLSCLLASSIVLAERW